MIGHKLRLKKRYYLSWWCGIVNVLLESNPELQFLSRIGLFMFTKNIHEPFYF
jgi:hypothetical protein